MVYCEWSSEAEIRIALDNLDAIGTHRDAHTRASTHLHTHMAKVASSDIKSHDSLQPKSLTL